MADTFIQLATDSTGKKIDTRTEASNSEHRQVVVIGDPSVNANVAPVDVTNGLSVNVTNASLTVGSHNVTNAGTFAVQAAQSGTWTVQPGNTANTTAWKVDGSAVTQPVSGTVTANAGSGFNANGSTTSANSSPVVIASDQAAVAVKSGATGSAVPAGAMYEAVNAATALPSAATAGNLTGVMGDKFGRYVVQPITIRDLTGTQTTTISASTSETTIVTAIASTFNDLVMLVVSNTSSATNTRIDFRDTTGGSVLFSLQSNGGQPPVGFCPAVAIPQTTVNTNWTAQCATSTTDIRIYAVYAKNK